MNRIVLGAALLALLTACQREQLASNPAEKAFQAPGNSAAAHLAASEKLDIPAAVALPPGSTRVATFYAVGVQKYRARIKAGSNPVTYEWALVAPDARLFNASNEWVGTHGAGPFWALSPQDSLFAQHFAPARTAPSPDPGSIDWLLLRPREGRVPTGMFASVAFIQRIATQGGKAPATPPSSLNDTVDVKYKAVYRFSRP